MALLIARLGASVMGGHQIMSNIAAIAFQIPLALGLATATATAQALGAGDALRARRAAFTGMRMAVATASVAVVTIWVLRGGVVGLSTAAPAVTTVALSLISFLVVFHVFDALQGITAFVLRAYKIVVVPTVIYAGALWGLGLVGGYFVGFHSVLGGPCGASGMWLMQSVALCLTSLLLLGFYVWVLRQQRMVVGATVRGWRWGGSRSRPIGSSRVGWHRLRGDRQTSIIDSDVRGVASRATAYARRLAPVSRSERCDRIERLTSH